MSLTFGFEAEFATNLRPLTRELYRRELVGMDEPHSYHCDCEWCEFDLPANRDFTEYYRPLRVQNDSSCDGEVISNICTLDDADIFRELESAALDADAEPGLVAGFHVHVEPRTFIGRTADQTRGIIGLQFTRMEPLLLALAGGAMVEVRGFNRHMRSMTSGFVSDILADLSDDGRMDEDYVLASWPGRLDLMNEHANGFELESFLYYVKDLDRHMTWNARTNGPTTEFRLWNSTRAAWRMELFVRMSIALSSRWLTAAAENHDTLAQLCAVDIAAAKDWLLGVCQLNDPRLAELAERQFTYASEHEPVLAFS